MTDPIDAVVRVATATGASRDLDEILTTACESAVAIFRAGRARKCHSAIVLFSDDETGTVIAEFPNLGARWRSVPLFGVQVEEQLLTSRRPVIVDDVDTDERLGPHRGLLQELRIRSLLLVPVFSRSRILGLFSIDSLDERRTFHPDDIELCEALAAHVAIAIENDSRLAKMHAALDIAERRSKLLSKLVDSFRHVPGEKELPGLIVREAVRLLGYSIGFLYEYDSRTHRLRNIVTEPSSREVTEQWEPLACDCAREAIEREATDVSELALRQRIVPEALIAASIRPVGQEKVLLLVLVNSGPRSVFLETDREILTLFTKRVSGLFQEARARDFERRLVERAGILHRISGYMLSVRDVDKILTAVLTAVTAGYGFGLNRAAVFLFDARREFVEGRQAIGHYKEAEQQRAWEEHLRERRESFDAYLRYLADHGPVRTPLDERTREVRLNVFDLELWPFLESLFSGPRRIDVEDLERELPSALRRVLQPHSSVFVIPLAWNASANPITANGAELHDDVVGFILADNAFTGDILSDEDMAILSELASTAAIAIDKVERHTLTHVQVARLEAIEHKLEIQEGFADLQTVETQFVKGALEIFRGHAAMFWSFDPQTEGFNLRAWAGAIPDDVRKLLQRNPPGPGQTTYTVQDRKWLGIDDLDASDAIAVIPAATREALRRFHVQSFQGVSLELGAEQLGVLYVNYDRPMQFTIEDKIALTSYADQAVLTLKKARLLDQVLRARNTAKALAQLSAHDDIATTFEAFVEKTRLALECHSVTLYEYSAELDRLRYPPAMAGVTDRSRATSLPGVQTGSVVRRMLDKTEIEIVDDAASHEMFGPTRFRREEGICSLMAIPLHTGETKVGVMFVNYDEPHRFTFDERTNIHLFADLAAVAIRSAQLFGQLQEKRASIIATYKASQEVMGSLDMGQILDRVAEQAWHLASASGDSPAFASVTVSDDGENWSLNTYPASAAPFLHDVRAKATPGTEFPPPVGLVLRTIQENHPQVVRDVVQNLHHVPIPELGSKSAIVVPIRIGDDVVGAIDVEHPNAGALRQDEVKALEELAFHAGVAIKNVRQHEALTVARQAEDVVLNLAAFGIASEEWGHDIDKIAFSLHKDARKAKALVGELRQVSTSEALTSRISDLEQQIDRLCALVPRLTKPAIIESPHDHVEPIRVKHFIENFFKTRRNLLEFDRISLTVECEGLTDMAIIRANRRWLTQVFTHVTTNAMEVMQDRPDRSLTVRANHVGDRVEVDIIDSGPGIPEALRKILLNRIVEKGDDKEGLGIGLMLARTIARIYGGELMIGKNAPGSGADIHITLPVTGITANHRTVSKAKT